MDWASASGDVADKQAAELHADGEAVLLVRARTDPAAFEILYWRHHRALWRYVRHRTGESHAADDLVAEVFIELLKSLPGFRLRGGGLRGWLYLVASRKVARWSKRQKGQSFDDEVHGRTHAPAGATTREEHVRKALEALPQRLQTLLVLHHLDGIPVERIAEMLGTPEGTIKSRLARGREELRQKLSRFEGAP